MNSKSLYTLANNFDKYSSLLPLCRHCSASLSFQAGSPFTCKIVGGVVIDCDPVAKLKIAKFFLVC